MKRIKRIVPMLIIIAITLTTFVSASGNTFIGYQQDFTVNYFNQTYQSRQIIKTSYNKVGGFTVAPNYNLNSPPYESKDSSLDFTVYYTSGLPVMPKQTLEVYNNIAEIVINHNNLSPRYENYYYFEASINNAYTPNDYINAYLYFNP